MIIIIIMIINTIYTMIINTIIIRRGSRLDL